ncbi:hypothetical protein QBC45DRAFT_407566 [Copromyces sp. CBS 386.78]|nr:hypothetical protein QBC45DRAFT_407566 [Copromyces sp. CBS 386.78]
MADATMVICRSTLALSLCRTAAALFVKCSVVSSFPICFRACLHHQSAISRQPVSSLPPSMSQCQYASAAFWGS